MHRPLFGTLDYPSTQTFDGNFLRGLVTIERRLQVRGVLDYRAGAGIEAYNACCTAYFKKYDPKRTRSLAIALATAEQVVVDIMSRDRLGKSSHGLWSEIGQGNDPAKRIVETLDQRGDQREASP